MRCEPFTKSENYRPHHTPTPSITKAYLLGALHDSTKTKYTFRICQKYLEYIDLISTGINTLGFKSWIYKEGKDRDLYIVEFSKKLLADTAITTSQDKIDYIRGYFDSEGSVPRNLNARYYIYFAQKKLTDLSELRTFLEDLGMNCGSIHIPSSKVDPNYFRFYVLRNSWGKFGELIGSYHPVKQKYIRMKI